MGADATSLDDVRGREQGVAVHVRGPSEPREIGHGPTVGDVALRSLVTRVRIVVRTSHGDMAARILADCILIFYVADVTSA